MQTLSGVAVDDGRAVVACVRPGKYPAGSEVVVESRHVVDKPHSLDWERAAMLPFLVRKGKGLRLVGKLTHAQPLEINPVDIYPQQVYHWRRASTLSDPPRSLLFPG